MPRHMQKDNNFYVQIMREGHGGLLMKMSNGLGGGYNYNEIVKSARAQFNIDRNMGVSFVCRFERGDCNINFNFTSDNANDFFRKSLNNKDKLLIWVSEVRPEPSYQQPARRRF